MPKPDTNREPGEIKYGCVTASRLMMHKGVLHQKNMIDETTFLIVWFQVKTAQPAQASVIKM